MKFRKLVVYDLRSEPLKRDFIDKLKTFADDVITVFAEKEYDGTLKPEHLKGADALIIRIFDNFKPELWKSSNLKYIGAMHTDYSHYDLDVLKSKGIILCYIPHYATEAVAELTISVLLNISRQTADALNFVKSGRWGFEHFMGWELKGKTMGIIGLGAIGSRMAELALALGMKVVYYSRTRKPEYEKRGCKYCSLEDLLKTGDVVSIHTPLTKETENILNRERLGMMKQGAVLLNSARSELCDLDAVYDLTKAGKITAWIEAVEDPEIRKKFQTIKNILLTPHYGWMTKKAQQNLRDITIKNIEMFLKGKPINKV